MNEINENVSRSLRKLRESWSMSQRALAKELDLSNSSVAMYESGARAPSFDVLCAYSRFFDVPVSEIVSGNHQAPAVSDADLKFALFGGDKDITDEQFEEVKRYARYLKERDEL